MSENGRSDPLSFIFFRNIKHVYLSIINNSTQYKSSFGTSRIFSSIWISMLGPWGIWLIVGCHMEFLWPILQVQSRMNYEFDNNDFKRIYILEILLGSIAVSTKITATFHCGFEWHRGVNAGLTMSFKACCHLSYT